MMVLVALGVRVEDQFVAGFTIHTLNFVFQVLPSQRDGISAHLEYVKIRVACYSVLGKCRLYS
jgi:hypothetical protein